MRARESAFEQAPKRLPCRWATDDAFLKKYICFIFGWVGASSLCLGFLQQKQGGLLFVVVHGLLTAAASLVAEHRLQACQLQELQLTGSRAWAPQLWHNALVALRQVESSQTRDCVCVPCTGFSSTAPSGKSQVTLYLFIYFQKQSCLPFYLQRPG